MEKQKPFLSVRRLNLADAVERREAMQSWRDQSEESTESLAVKHIRKRVPLGFFQEA